MKQITSKFSLLLCTLLGATSVSAATKYWDTNGITAGAGGATPSGVWDTGTTANWTVDSAGAGAGTTWAANDDAIFSAATDATGSWTVTIGATTTNFANSVTVQEGTILMGPGYLSFGNVNGIFDIANGTTWNISGGGSGFVAGSAGITKNGLGTLFLGGSELYTNGTSTTAAFLTINAGTVDFSGDTALGIVPANSRAGAVTINNNATLRFSGTTAVTLNVNRGITISASGGTIEVTSAASTGLSLASAAAFTLNGTGLCTKTGAGRFTLNTTANTFTGKYKILGGTLSEPGDGRFGTVPGATVADYFILDGATAGIRDSLTTALTIDPKRGITLGAGGGTLQQPAPGVLTYNGIIAGTSGGTLRIALTDAAGGGGTGFGAVVLGGANTYDGATTVAASTALRLGAAGVIPDGSGVTISASTAALDRNTFNERIGSLTSSGFITNSGLLDVTGTGGGTVAISGGTVSGGTTSNNNVFAISGGTVSGEIFAGTAALTKTGSGTIALNSANTYSGKTIVGAGELQVSLDGGFGAVPSSYLPDAITLTNGGGIRLQVTAVTLAANRGITIGTGGGTIDVPSGQSPVINAPITGAGALTKITSGNVDLTASNSFAGGFTITGGGVRFRNDYAAGTGTITVTPASIVTLRNLNPPLSVTLTNPILLNANGGNDIDLAAGNGATFTLAGNITGTGYMTRNRGTAGTGTVVLSGDNYGWSGGLLVRGSVTALGNKSALGTGLLAITPANANPATLQATTALTGANAVTNSVQIAISNATQQVTISGASDLELSGPVSLGQVGSLSPVIITNSNSGATIISGPISGAGFGLTVAGTGKLTLSGVNTYDGATTVSAGTLLVNSPGSLAAASAVTVNSGGTLGGTAGNINGTVTINSGGTLAPGASVGTLNSGAEVWSGGGNYVFEIADAAGVAGTDWDLLNITGNLDVQATTGSKFTIEVHTLNGGSAGDAANFSPANTDYSWPFATVTTTIDNFAANKFTLNTAYVSNNIAGGHFAIDAVAPNLLLLFVSNRPPVAVTDTASRPADLSLKVAITSLLANDTDVDSAFGDSISFVGVSATSTNNASVSNDTAFVYYLPPNSDPTNNVTDSFSYTIADNFGHVSAGTVIVTMSPASTGLTPNITGISTNGDGNYTISFAGIPGQIYVVEATPTLVGPTWTPISTNTAGLNGLWNYTDLDATNFPSRFYRTATP